MLIRLYMYKRKCIVLSAKDLRFNMKYNKGNRKALILAVSSLLALQQAVITPSFGASSIIDAGGNILKPNDQTGNFEFRPDAFKDDIGFKHFQEFVLGKGDVANFIFEWYNKQYGSNPDIKLESGDISKFVTFIDGQANINGIVNALNALNGTLKTDGQLIFVAPGGLVVGSSGVLNVGSLSVLTPTDSAYQKLKEGMPTDIQYSTSGTVNNAQLIDKNWDPNSIAIGNGPISVDGRIIARGDVELNGGKIAIGPTGAILAGIGKNTDTLMNKPGSIDSAAVQSKADALFNALVKTDNMDTGNEFSTSHGNIVIKSNVGTQVDAGGMLRTYSAGDILIDNTGLDGVIINGEVANSNGNLTITNAAGKIASADTAVIKNKGNMTILNHENGTGIDLDGEVTNTGTMKITNETGADGLIIRGNVTNNEGAATITNKVNRLNVESKANVVSNGKSLLMENSGANGMHIMGHVDQNNKGTLDFKGTNSNIVIGDNTDNDFYVTSDGETTFTVDNGNLYNYGVAKTLIQTTDGANLTMKVTNGAIGKEVGPCDGDSCTGIGTQARDWTKSVNVNVDGVITAESKGNNALINLASAGKDMNLNYVKSDGRVILLADDINNKATDTKPTYSILNRAKEPDTINIEGTGISVIAGKDIGEKGKKVTFRQNGVKDIFDGDDATKPHVPDYASKNSQGVDMLAIRDINVKGMDADDGSKLDTNVCAMIARTGSIDAEFSGNTYIREITADKNIDLVTRGKNLYIENLGLVPTYAQDYYGQNKDVVPEKVTIKALDLGSYWDENEAPEYEHAADSTVVIKNGKINGTTEGRPNTQDLTITADNAYAGGYYFNMGKHRGEDGKSKVTADDFTNPIKNSDGENISIRGKAVRPEDVKAVGGDPENQTQAGGNGRNYYYGGSEQGNDPDYDKDGSKVHDDDKGTDKDDDNLVVPTEPTEPTEPTVPTEPTKDTEPTEPTKDTTPTEPTEDTTPTEPTKDTTPTEPTEDTTPTEPTKDTTPTEPTEDTTPTEPTKDTTPTEPTKDTTPTEPTKDTTPTEPTKDTTPTEPTKETQPSIDNDDVGKLTWVQRKDISDGVPVIDKRQYMRFDLNSEADMVEFESDSGADAILNISRGGVQLSHNKKLKVGDIIPVKVKYGDLEINANVKIVSASDVKAGGEFIDLDQATANKLLYLNLMLDETVNYAEANMKPVINTMHIQ